MTPEEIYALPDLYPPETDSAHMWDFAAHLEEACLGGYENQVMEAVDQDPDRRLVARLHFSEDFDGERGMTMASIWFDGSPVMLVQQAGRGERDFRDRFITDGPRFWAMIEYLQRLKNRFVAEDTRVEDPRRDNLELTEFYGQPLALVGKALEIVYPDADAETDAEEEQD